MAIELGWKKETSAQTCKLTDVWSLHELKKPLIVAEKLHMTPPENAKVVVLTHLGMEVINRAAEQATWLTDQTGIPAIAGKDGMSLYLEEKIEVKKRQS